MTPVHIPVIRRGKAYESLDKTNVIDHRTGAVLATVSQVNAGIIRKDLARIAESRAALKKFSVNYELSLSTSNGKIYCKPRFSNSMRIATCSC